MLGRQERQIIPLKRTQKSKAHAKQTPHLSCKIDTKDQYLVFTPFFFNDVEFSRDDVLDNSPSTKLCFQMWIVKSTRVLHPFLTKLEIISYQLPSLTFLKELPALNNTSPTKREVISNGSIDEIPIFEILPCYILKCTQWFMFIYKESLISSMSLYFNQVFFLII